MKVEHAISIDAPKDIVWSVTRHVERWPEWTPTVTSVTRVDRGPFGRASVARIKQPMQPEAEWVVTEFETGHRFAWETRRLGLHMTATHELSPDAAGTKNTLRAEARGLGAALLWPLLRIALRRALAEENRGLKARCEGIVRAAACRTTGNFP